jgi:hypothetical protein
MTNLRLINFLLFQLGWLACVLAAAAQQAWLGSLLGLGVVVLHFVLSKQPQVDFKILVLVLILGGSWDSLLTALGILRFDSGMMISLFAPHWILVMWLLFATTLNSSLSWMQGRYLLAAVFGAIGGPLAYRAGAALGAVDFSSTFDAMVIIGVGWMLLMPTFVVMAEAARSAPAEKETSQ